MTRDRIDDFVSMVIKAREKEGISVSISIERHCEVVHVFTVVPVNGIDSTFYTTSEFYKEEDKHVIRNGSIIQIYDPNLKAAEEHVRRLLK